MKAITIIILGLAAVMIAAVVWTAMQVKSAVDDIHIINASKIMYESPVGQVFSPFAPVILIVFGIVCFLVFMVKSRL